MAIKSKKETGSDIRNANEKPYVYLIKGLKLELKWKKLCESHEYIL